MARKKPTKAEEFSNQSLQVNLRNKTVDELRSGQSKVGVGGQSAGASEIRKQKFGDRDAGQRFFKDPKTGNTVDAEASRVLMKSQRTGVPVSQLGGGEGSSSIDSTIGGERVSATELALASAARGEAIAGLGGAADPTAVLQTEGAADDALILGSVATGALAGATAGSIIPIAGTAIGGLIGGLGGLTAALTTQRRQATKEANKVFTISTGRDYQLIMNLANQGASPAEIMTAYNTMLANVRVSERALKKETQNALGRELSGAQDELTNVQLWLENEPMFRQQLILAMQNPNPAAVFNLPEPLPEQ